MNKDQPNGEPQHAKDPAPAQPTPASAPPQAAARPDRPPPIQRSAPTQKEPDRVVYDKPDWFDARELCEAPLNSKEPAGELCQEPREKCKKHCGRWARTRGYACGRTPVPGLGCCTVHGGSSLVGAANPAFKHGGRSKLRPKHLRAEYDRAMDDPELLSARRYVALWEARCQELVQQLESSGSGKLFTDLRREFAVLKASVTVEQMAKIERMIESGANYAEQWAELERASDTRTRYAKAEWQRLVDMQQMVSKGEALTIVYAIIDSVHRNVKDREVLSAIQADYVRATGMAGKPAAIETDSDGE